MRQVDRVLGDEIRYVDAKGRERACLVNNWRAWCRWSTLTPPNP